MLKAAYMANTRPTLDLDLVWKAGHLPKKSVDPELFALLEAIKNTGKLTEATEQVGMPYRQAWGLITTWSERMGQPLVTKEQGRGTQLTALGQRLLWIRERINARLTPHLESAASEVEQELNEILNEPNPALTMFASHDLVLAELREFLRTRPGPKLDVRFVGSLDSVVALCKGRCELAGFHVPEGLLGREILRKYEPWLKPRAQRSASARPSSVLISKRSWRSSNRMTSRLSFTRFPAMTLRAPARSPTSVTSSVEIGPSTGLSGDPFGSHCDEPARRSGAGGSLRATNSLATTPTVRAIPTRRKAERRPPHRLIATRKPCGTPTLHRLKIVHKFTFGRRGCAVATGYPLLNEAISASTSF